MEEKERWKKERGKGNIVKERTYTIWYHKAVVGVRYIVTTFLCNYGDESVDFLAS